MNEPVLIVDDNASKRVALRSVLAPAGYAIVEASSGVEALRCVAERDFAVILLDVRMPHMDGFETAAMIRLRQQSELTPIIFVTAFASDQILNTDRYAEGAVDFMCAPVHPAELRAKVAVFAGLFTKAESLAAQARAVQHSADRLLLLTDTAPIGIFQTDAENNYVYTNPRWTEIAGVSAADALGRPWHSIIETPDGGEDSAAFPSPGDTIEISRRFEVLREGASAVIAQMTARPIPDEDGDTAGWVGTLADVTAEVGAEAAMANARDEADAASQSKSDFLANMSHEIRTPMNGVIGMTDLLLETQLDARQRDYAQTVRNSGEALLTIIDDILDFSKVEAGMLEIEDIEFSPRTVVSDVVDLLAGPAQAKGIEVMAIVDNSVPLKVCGDPGRVRQVLTNLIGNAIKFTRAGEIVVRLAGDKPIGAGPVLRFDVTDSGDGLAPEKLDVIFQPFAQADTSTSRKYGGTGLGLAISTQLVSLMGGTCGVSSELGEGSNFWFTVGVHQAAGHATAAPGPDLGLGGATALVVDGNVTHRGWLAERLGGWGMRVLVAESGDAALAELRGSAQGKTVDVVLVNQTLSGLDGLELSHQLSADPTIPARVILMTGLGKEVDLRDPKTSGVFVSIARPIHEDQLLEAVRSAVSGSEIPTEDIASSSVTPSVPTPVGTGLRLLLAEDNLINQKVAVAMLTQAGYLVDTALNGAEAVAAHRTQNYTAVLMDCQMPELNGYEATAAIREREGDDRHTPIIAMTAGARREDRRRCMAAGMDGYLAKPVSKDALLTMLASWVRRIPAVPTATPQLGARERRPVGDALDPVVINELWDLAGPNNHEWLDTLVEEFIVNTEAQLAHLREAIESEDAATVKQIAHKIRGGAGTLGGRRLALSCRRLESKVAAGHISDSGADLRDMESDYEELRRALTFQPSTTAGIGSVERAGNR